MKGIDEMNSKQEYVELKPRRLGDEWENWNGQIEQNEGNLATDSKLFLSLVSLTNILLLGLIWTVYFFIRPHISNFMTHNFINWLTISITVLILTYFILFLLTLWLNKPFVFYLKDKQLADLIITKISLGIGKKLGFSYDRIVHSMLQVGNHLTRILYQPIAKDELLILVPRCLSKQTREELIELTKSYHLNFHIAAGGSQAREILKEKKSKGIIAVACERDLYAGVKDVPSHIPVLAIANTRPEGPCTNTLVDLDQLKSSIDFFLDVKLNSSHHRYE